MSKFDDFGAEVRHASASAHRRGCGVSKLLDELSPEDADKVREVLDDNTVSHNAIEAALRRRLGGNAPTSFTIGRHRRKQCTCHLGVELK